MLTGQPKSKIQKAPVYSFGLKGRAGAPESAHEQRGGSPLRAYALRPESECNCAAVRQGGEQQEENNQSVRPQGLNPVRQDRVTSLLANGEVQTAMRQKPPRFRVANKRRRDLSGDRGRNGWKFGCVNQGPLCGPDGVHADVQPKSRRTGGRAPIVVSKPGNAGGAKGRRKMETR